MRLVIANLALRASLAVYHLDISNACTWINIIVKYLQTGTNRPDKGI